MLILISFGFIPTPISLLPDVIQQDQYAMSIPKTALCVLKLPIILNTLVASDSSNALNENIFSGNVCCSGMFDYKT